MPIDLKIKGLKGDVGGKLKKVLDTSLNAYRQVRGDGNCFFRSFAFSYLANLQSKRASEAFSMLDEVCLEVCSKQSIPKEFASFYEDSLLKAVLRKYF